MVAIVATLASCTVTKRHYAPGYHVEWKHFSKNQTINEITHSEKSSFQSNSNFDEVKFDVPASNMVANSECGRNDILSSIRIEEVKKNEWVSLPIVTKKVSQPVNFQRQGDIGSNQPDAVKVQTQKGPDGMTWLVYVALVLCTWIFSGPIFIAIWTSKMNGSVDWKSVLISFFLWWLCFIPGLIYDIIWINKNCNGSLFND